MAASSRSARSCAAATTFMFVERDGRTPGPGRSAPTVLGDLLAAPRAAASPRRLYLAAASRAGPRSPATRAGSARGRGRRSGPSRSAGFSANRESSAEPPAARRVSPSSPVPPSAARPPKSSSVVDGSPTIREVPARPHHWRRHRRLAPRPGTSGAAWAARRARAAGACPAARSSLGEFLADAARREVFEETGLMVNLAT